MLKSKVTNIWPYHTIRTSVTPMSVRGDEWDDHKVLKSKVTNIWPYGMKLK